MAALHHAAEAALLTWFELLYVPFSLLLLILGTSPPFTQKGKPL
jgi:hypothetical protein